MQKALPSAFLFSIIPFVDSFFAGFTINFRINLNKVNKIIEIA